MKKTIKSRYDALSALNVQEHYKSAITQTTYFKPGIFFGKNSEYVAQKRDG